MKNSKTVGKVIAALAIGASCAMPAMAQSTTADTSANNATTTMPATERVEDNDRDFGWIGLLGLAGLLGLRRKPEEQRNTNLSQQR